jgi:NitT/TauT family transport system ATP-binding protein
MSAAFSVSDAGKAFLSREGTRVEALAGASLEGREGEITCLVGPTGSGKTTLLRLAAGLEEPDRGRVSVGGRPPGEQVGRIGYLTQRHTLLPWLRAGENVELALKLRGMDAGERKARVAAIMESLGLGGAGYLYPYELSGGMQQRAALGRLMAMEAPYWLLDEPFTNLDERTQHHLQRLLLRLVREHRVSVLFVTHSIDEAVYLADQVAVLSAGPGRVVETLRPHLPHPRDRLSPGYGELMEAVRRSIEAVITEGGNAA